MEETLPDLAACIERFHEAFHKPVILTEFGADAVDGMHADPPQMFSEEYQANTIRLQYREVRNLPYVIGTHVWAFADFRTAQCISRIIFNRKGVFTRDRQPKLAAHVLRELWSEED